IGLVGASVGLSLNNNTITNTVRAYIDAAVDVTEGNIEVTSGSTTNVEGLAVATSVAAGKGAAAGAGADSDSIVGGTVESYLGPDAVVDTGPNDLIVRATSSSTAKANTVGVAVAGGIGVVPIGVSLSDAKLNGTTKAYIQGSVDAAHNVTGEAVNVATAASNAFALAGGIGLGVSGAGTQSITEIKPTVSAYVQSGDIGTATTPVTGDVIIRSRVETDGDAEGLGVAFTVGAAISGS